jgi:hypothetical protein
MKARNAAADILRVFLLDTVFAETRITTLMTSVKTYRYSVMECQSIARSFLAIRSARILCLSRYWDSLATEWWVGRQKATKKKEKKASQQPPTVMIKIKE